MRKISEKLMRRLTEGDLVPLRDYVKSDSEIRLEVRRLGEAFIYYRGGKALEVGSLKVDSKYGNVPSKDLAVNNPPEYFKLIKQSIDNWLERGNGRPEFDSQQKIALYNQDKDDKYIVLDMEYIFEQHEIEAANREKKRAKFDLLGIERETGKIIFFEVKKGMGSTDGKAGINDHIKDFEIYINGKNRDIFRNNLIRDVKNIIADKIRLGLISNFESPKSLSQNDPEHVFVFHPNESIQTEYFKQKLQGRTKLIVVSNDDYKLR